MWIQVFAVFGIVFFLVKCLMELKSKLGNRKRSTNKDGTQALKKKIPGMEPSDPEKGNLSELFTDINFLRDLHKRYGSIASFWEGKKLAVSVADPNMFKQMKHLFLLPADIFEGFKLYGDDAFGFCEIEEIRRRRKLYEQHFMLKACKTYTNIFTKIAKEYIKKWESLEKCDQLSIRAEVARASLDALSRTTYGDIFEDEQKMRRFHELNDYVISHLNPFPSPDSPERKQIVENVQELKSVVKEVLKVRKTAKKDDDERLFIDLLLEEEFTEEQRLSDAFFIISVGYQATSTHISWTIYELCKNQDIQEKLYQHIVSVVGDEPITTETIPKLTYLKQVLEEVLRHTSKYFFLVRKTHEDLVLDGYFIPKDTNIYNPLGTTGGDPKHFSHPEKFNPDHFTPENVRLRHAFAFKPFGYAGKRQCLGQSFAMAEASIFIAEWCRCFRFFLAPGQREDVGFNASFVPEEEIWITLEKRT